jgi:hypothetical protein
MEWITHDIQESPHPASAGSPVLSAFNTAILASDMKLEMDGRVATFQFGA